MIKIIYNTDDAVAASEWVREEVKSLETFDAPQMTSALKIKQQGTTMRGRIVQNAIGYFMLKCNQVKENACGVAMFSSCNSDGNGLRVTKENLNKAITLFAARRCIQGNWINDKDEYLEPNHE